MNKLNILYAPATEATADGASAQGDIYAQTSTTEGSTSDGREAPAEDSRAGAREAGGGLPSEADAAGGGGETADSGEAATAAAGASAESDEEKIERIAQAIAKGMYKGQPQVQSVAQPQKQLSQQELDKLLNRFQVNADVLRGLGFTEASPEQVTAFQAFADNIVRNATTVANLAIQAHLEKLQTDINPVRDFVQQAQMQEMRKSFFGKFKDLEKYETLVRSVAGTVSGQNADGSAKSVDQAMKEVAEATRKILKDSGINLAETAGVGANRGAAQGEAAVPKMQQLAGAGRSSSGGQAGSKNNPEADIYSKWQ